MAVTLKGGDQHQTPQFTIAHADHGLEEAHVEFIKSVMAKRETGEFICESFPLPEGCPDLLDGLYGPLNGDEAVEEDEVFYEVRGDRPHPSRMVDRPLRPCRNIVVIGICNKMLYTAYGSVAGIVAPREPWDHFFSDPTNAAAKAEAEEIWAVHALAKPRS